MIRFLFSHWEHCSGQSYAWLTVVTNHKRSQIYIAVCAVWEGQRGFRQGERQRTEAKDGCVKTVFTSVAQKKKAVNKKSPALRKSLRKKRICSSFPEPQPQLDHVDVEDTENTELEVDIVASERDFSISISDASDDGAATARYCQDLYSFRQKFVRTRKYP